MAATIFIQELYDEWLAGIHGEALFLGLRKLHKYLYLCKETLLIISKI